MKKANIIALFAGVVASVMLIAGSASVAFAQVDSTSDYSYTTDYGTDYSSDYSSSDADAAGAILGSGFVIVFYCCCGIFWLAYMIVFVMSLIDCIQNATPDKKTLWIILILLVPFAAIYYFFAMRGKWGNVVAVPVAGPVQPVA